MERTISVTIGNGCLKHNNRVFVAENVDADRISQNVVFVQRDLRGIYHELFDEAVEEYNAKQKRKDRIIQDYYNKIKDGHQEHLFTEVIVQIGNMKDSNCMMEETAVVRQILEEYMRGFEGRNPSLRVFNAVLHMDEQTPHLHIDFVPFSEGNKRGISTKVSLKGAMKALGFAGTGRNDTESMQWVRNEKENLATLMQQRGFGWKKLGTHEKHLSVYNYEKKMRKQEVEELERRLQDKADTMEQQERCMESNWEKLRTQRKRLEELEQSYRRWEVKQEEAEDRYLHYLSLNNELKQKYDALQREHRNLQNSKETLRLECDQFQGDYRLLQGDYKLLTNQHGKLQDEVEKLLTDKKSVELALATAKDEMETMQAETGVVRAERDRVIEETEEAKRQVTSHLKTAENLYYKYSSVAVTDRQAEFFDEIVKTRYEKEKLEYENQKLQSENNTLRQILDKAEEFMRELTINGRNLWDAFKERIADILPGNGDEHLHSR